MNEYNNYVEYIEEYLSCPEKFEGCYESYFSSSHNEMIYEHLIEEDYYQSDAVVLKKSRKRAIRRKNNWKKARHKFRNNKFGWKTLDDLQLNRLNKGKGFCSCSCCTPKTNEKGKTYFGRTKVRTKKRNWRHSDAMKIDNTTYSFKEEAENQDKSTIL